MHRRQPGAAGGRGDEVVHGLPRERLSAFGDEEPGQRVGANGAVALDGAQLVAGDGMFDIQAALKPAHPQARVVEIDLRRQLDGARSQKSDGWATRDARRMMCAPNALYS